jgi:hypothetical protein
LLVANEPVRAHRCDKLKLINDYRIACAHSPFPPSQDALETMWAAVAADPGAFFRYFGAALVSPPDQAGGSATVDAIKS